MKNPYLPMPVKIDRIVLETEDRNIKTFCLSFVNKEDEASFKYVPGQFAELSIMGKGEAPFGMASSHSNEGHIEFSVSKIGVVTTALHNMSVGDTIGIRGPLGNGYPIEKLQGKNVVIVGGGFGFSTLRALTNYMIDERNQGSFGNITVFYGARSPGLLLYKDDLREWAKRSDLQLNVTVDRGDADWKGKSGMVTDILKAAAPSADNAYAIVCGPPIMIKFTLPVIKELGFSSDRTLLSLEMRMKCGLGKCGRCNVGSKYVCSDGPVFTESQLHHLHAE